MDFRQLRYFEAAVEQRGMGAAARACAVSQPTMSAQIRALELELNEALFHRTPAGLHPTPAALAAFQRLSPLLSQAIHAQAYLRSGTTRAIETLVVALEQPGASLIGCLARRAGQTLGRDLPFLHVLYRAAESPTAADEPPDVALAHHVGPVPEGSVAFPDRWVLVEIGPPGRTPGRGDRRRLDASDLSRRGGYLDVPKLSNEGRAALIHWSRLGVPVPMTMVDDDANATIAAILVRNQGQALVPRLAIAPAFLHHPRLAILTLDCGLPPLHLVVAARARPGPVLAAFQAALAPLLRRPASRAAPPLAVPLPDARQLRYFLRVLEAGSISRAAAQLNVVQPAISMQIKALERRLGGRLIDRSFSGVSPTERGRMVRTLFQPIVQALQDETMAAAAERQRERHSLRVGVLPGFDEESLLIKATTATVVAWRALYPQIDLRVVEAQSGVLLDWLAAQQIDVAIVEDMHARTVFRETVLSSEPLAIVTGAAPALCAPGPIAIGAIARLSLVLPSPRHGLRALLDRTFVAAGLRLVPQLQLDSMASAMRLVKAGGWATVMPPSAVQSSLDNGSLRAHPIVGPVVSRELRAVQRDRPPRSWESEFIRLLRNRLALRT